MVSYSVRHTLKSIMEDLLFSGVANPRFTLGFPVLKITESILYV